MRANLAAEFGLPRQRLSASGGADAFDTPVLVEGRDEIALTLDHLPVIEAFERAYAVIPVDISAM